MVYVGSKSRISKFLVPIIQKILWDNNIKTYIEPFVGGANIIDKIQCENKYGYDSHSGLIEIYKGIQGGWAPPLHCSEDMYKDAKVGKIEDPLKSYIGFEASYGSKYFGGFARGFKSDGATPRDIYNERTRNFIKQIPDLLNIEFECKDYLEIDVRESLIYCDPPYANTTKYSTKNFDHNIFWKWVRSLSLNNIVLVSEFSAPADFKSIWSIERQNSLDVNKTHKRVENLYVIRGDIL